MKERLTLKELSYRKIGIFFILKKWFRDLCYIECPSCKRHRVKHSHSEIMSFGLRIEVYECKYCKTKFV